MSLPTDKLLNEVVNLPPVKRIKTTVNQAVKSGALVGAATIISGIIAGPVGLAAGIYLLLLIIHIFPVTIISGIIAGPVGLAAGGIISSCLASYCTWGTYESVPYILCNEATPEQREKLACALRGCLNTRQIITIRDFILAVQSNEQLVEAIVQILIIFLSSEMGRKVII